MPTKLFRQSQSDKVTPTQLFRQSYSDNVIPTKLYLRNYSDKAIPTQLFRQNYSNHQCVTQHTLQIPHYHTKIQHQHTTPNSVTSYYKYKNKYSKRITSDTSEHLTQMLGYTLMVGIALSEQLCRTSFVGTVLQA